MGPAQRVRRAHRRRGSHRPLAERRGASLLRTPRLQSRRGVPRRRPAPSAADGRDVESRADARGRPVEARLMPRKFGNPAKQAWDPIKLGPANPMSPMAREFYSTNGAEHHYVYRTAMRASEIKAFSNRLYDGIA